MQIVNKHDKTHGNCGRFNPEHGSHSLLEADLRSCIIHKIKELRGIRAIQAGEVPKTAHWPKLTAMATMLKLKTTMAKKVRSH